MFKNREHAGKLLARKLLEIIGPAGQGESGLPTIVAAIPRGGVPVAVPVALALRAPLTLTVSIKLAHPSQPDLSIGAVSSSGESVICDDFESYSLRMRRQIDSEIESLKLRAAGMQNRWLQESGVRDNPDFEGMRAVLVDDGTVTGMTMLAAIRSLRLLGAREVVAAAPVISAESEIRLEKESDLLICLIKPYELRSLADFYEDFRVVQDEELTVDLKSVLNRYAFTPKADYTVSSSL